MPQINIARLVSCSEDGCSFPDNPHLALKIEQVELEKSQAVAISYTWGEFDRVYVNIGHLSQRSDDLVRMELGGEWEIPDLIKTLARICVENGKQRGEEHAAVWIDQLSIPQNNDQIRKALASIPSIYRTLDVVAVIPGGRCRCIGYGKEGYDGMQIPGCLNALGLCSYFDRVWTRQELLYSRSIRVVRTSTEVLPCVRRPAEDDTLPFVRWRAVQHMYSSPSSTEEGIYLRLVADQRMFFLKAASAMRECGMGRANTFKFLAGQGITKQQTPQDEKSRLYRFFENLKAQRWSDRRATKPRDYVLSIWTDCPGYVIPQNSRTMDLADLLEDALQQLEHNHELTLPTTAVRGLFRDFPTRSAIWSPKTYVKTMSIQGSHELYGVLHGGAGFIPVRRNGEISLCVPLSPNTPLSQLARGYSDVFRWQDATAVAKDLEPVIDNWPVAILANSPQYLLRIMDNLGTLDEGSVDLFRYMSFLSARANAKRMDRDANAEYFPNGMDRTLPSPTVDHETAIYMMVALALGLDYHVCLRRGLKVTVLLSSYPCIGLLNVDPRNKDMVTVCAGFPKNRQDCKFNGDLFYEVVRKDGPGNVRYRVCGVWVPFGYTFPYVPGGIIGGAILS